MIHFLKGIVAEVGDDFLCVDVQGVGYKVYAPARVLARVIEGEGAKVHTFTYVREDILALYGFLETAEKALFEKLMGVSGVGAKMALGLLSALQADEIVGAISRGDVTTLTRANGVGKKLAERIILELKNKLGSLPQAKAGPSGAVPAFAAVQQDVLSALMNMGFKQNLAQQALAEVLTNTPPSTPDDFGQLLKFALKTLRNA